MRSWGTVISLLLALWVDKTLRSVPGQYLSTSTLILFWTRLFFVLGFPGCSVAKNRSANVGDPGLIPGLGRSPGEGNGNPLYYSSLENSMDRGAWGAIVQGLQKSWTCTFFVVGQRKDCSYIGGCLETSMSSTWTFLVAQMVQTLPAVWETWAQSDPWVGKIPWRRAWWPTPVFLPRKSPRTEESGRPQSMRLQRVRHDWATKRTHALYPPDRSNTSFPVMTPKMLLLLSHFGRVRLCATPQMAAHQAPPSLGFSRQEHWSGVPFPSPMQESEKWKWSHSVVSDSVTPWTAA